MTASPSTMLPDAATARKAVACVEQDNAHPRAQPTDRRKYLAVASTSRTLIAVMGCVLPSGLYRSKRMLPGDGLLDAITMLLADACGVPLVVPLADANADANCELLVVSAEELDAVLTAVGDAAAAADAVLPPDDDGVATELVDDAEGVLLREAVALADVGRKDAEPRRLLEHVLLLVTEIALEDDEEDVTDCTLVAKSVAVWDDRPLNDGVGICELEAAATGDVVLLTVRRVLRVLLDVDETVDVCDCVLLPVTLDDDDGIAAVAVVVSDDVLVGLGVDDDVPLLVNELLRVLVTDEVDVADCELDVVHELV